MRVLFQNRSDALAKPGGDTTQMLKTKEGLERLGVQVDLILDASADYRPYDLVHVFNLQTHLETRPHVERAKAAGKPVALSTIWWSFWEYEINRIRRAHWNRLRRLLGTRATIFFFKHWAKRHRPNFENQRWLVHNADVLLPNSAGERDILIADFGLDPGKTRFQVVHNAIDAKIFKDAEPGFFAAQYGLKDFVLCAARIENRKNQLHLILAMKEIDLPLVLIGQPNPNQDDFVSLCRREAERLGSGRVRFIEHLPPDQLASAYAAAKVHALVSWLESPGLATMEAAVAGCNVVTTDRAPVEEYFGNLAWTCDPSSVRSIRRAIQSALAAPRSTALRDKIVKEFTWERAARETLQGYEAILRKK